MEDTVWLALPDGHQVGRTVEFLMRTGLTIEGYEVGLTEDRPKIEMEGVKIKVIRPQDMPLHVANGNFDLAITGQDWLEDHRCAFPASPVKEMLILRIGRPVNIGAIIKNTLRLGRRPVESVANFRTLAQTGRFPFPFVRVASEYVHLADRYARESHLGRYRVIPTSGKTEAYLPEDADILIENWESGETLKANGLKPIADLMKSWPCVIGNAKSMEHSAKKERMELLLAALGRGI